MFRQLKATRKQMESAGKACRRRREALQRLKPRVSPRALGMVRINVSAEGARAGRVFAGCWL